MLKFAILFVTATVLLYFFQPKPSKPGNHLNRYVSVEDTLHLPFDTVSVLALYDMPLSEFSENAPVDLDTFILSDLMYACECPNWATKNELRRLSQLNSTPDTVKQINRELYYIDRGDKSIAPPWGWSAFRNEIRFFGKIQDKPELPHDRISGDPHPPLGKVLVYYGYEVILPAVIYGPPVYVPDPTGKMPLWAQNDITRLIVTKKNYFPPKTKSR